jgi:RNA polymerase sigma-70 factor (ECF subfamily)
VLDTSASLLQRCRQNPEDTAWRRLVDLYSPWIGQWVNRAGLQGPDADDLVQEVLGVVVRRLPEFEHNARVGAFRAWLRTITVHCLRAFWRARRPRPVAAGTPDQLGVLDQLEDPHSDLSSAWDREHDTHVTRRLMQLVEPDFTPSTWQAFRRLVLDGATANDVAAELGISINAALIAKSRVLSRLRQEALGLVD